MEDFKFIYVSIVAKHEGLDFFGIIIDDCPRLQMQVQT